MPSHQQKAISQSPPQTPFPLLDDRQAALHSDLLTYRTFGAGAMILREGEPGDTMFLLEKGDVLFFTHDAQGREIPYRTLGAGQFFGEVALMLNEPRSANARAVTEVFAYELHRKNFDAYLEAHPDMRRTMMWEMAHRIKTSGELLRHTITPHIAGEIEGKRTPNEQVVQGWVRKIGSLPFLCFNTAAFVVWTIVNAAFLHWDTPPFAWLGVFATVEALLLTVLVLAKQNRDEKDSDVRADRILQNTATAEMELRHLRSRVDALTTMVHSANAANTPPPQKEPTDTPTVL